MNGRHSDRNDHRVRFASWIPGRSTAIPIPERRQRELIAGAVVISGLAVLGRVAGELEGVLRPSQWVEVADLAQFLAFATIAAILLGVVPMRAKQTPASLQTTTRTFLALLLPAVGLKAGMQYIHLCLAGSRLIEGGALLGTPIVVALLIGCIRQLKVALILAMILIALVWVFARPYLDFVHGN